MTILITGTPGSETTALATALNGLPGKPTAIHFTDHMLPADAAIFCVNGAEGFIEDSLDEFTHGLPLLGFVIAQPDDMNDCELLEMLEMEMRESFPSRGYSPETPVCICRLSLALQGDAGETNRLRQFLQSCNIH